MKQTYVDILNMPARNLVNNSLTKAFFLRMPTLLSTEKKLLQQHILRMDIISQIIPEKSNIPAVVNVVDSYEQILFIVCTLKENPLQTLAQQSLQLIHKYIAHQTVVIIQNTEECLFSTAEKRINQNDRHKLTVVQTHHTNAISKLYTNEVTKAFFAALDFEHLDKTDLKVLYQSYIQAIVQHQVAVNTGSFVKRSYQRTEADMETLAHITQLEQQITSLQSQLQKQTQFNEKVQINIQIHDIRTQINQLKTQLTQQ
jgi:hypothetical protein